MANYAGKLGAFIPALRLHRGSGLPRLRYDTALDRVGDLNRAHMDSPEKLQAI